MLSGATGVLGSEFVRTGSKQIIKPVSRRLLETLSVLDFCKEIEREGPDAFIHTAANTNVEQCEAEPGEAYRTNAYLTKCLVQACSENDVKFVYLSSTGIYGDHKKTPYTEMDAVEPASVHHISKFLGEQAVSKFSGSYLILRTGWLFGGEPTHQKNFVYNRYKESSRKRKIFSDPRQRGNPTSTADLVKQIVLMIEKGCSGTFNCVNDGAASRYDYVTEIIRGFGVDCEVVKAADGYFKRLAPVSFNESAVNRKLNLMGMNIMPGWKESLDVFVGELKHRISQKHITQ